MTEQALIKLNEEQIAAELETHSEWVELNSQIQRTFAFDDFIESMKFVNQMAEYAESVQHHPDILIRYNKVTLSVSTHDANGITHKDFDLATKADGLV
ncbi:MAG: 4a-hydroxytetrahydrobiopterin dehydratase [Phycisphaerales bacterium]|nr:4a-hydroxytetrahydrobiopterin dehydratase [Phycisphaerales bacterium]